MSVLHGYKFSCSFDNSKSKFYRAANCIFGKLEKLKNVPVTLHLVHTIAFPVLTYGIEAIPLNKTQLSSLDHPWSRIFMKNLIKILYSNGSFIEASYHFVITTSCGECVFGITLRRRITLYYVWFLKSTVEWILQNYLIFIIVLLMCLKTVLNKL